MNPDDSHALCLECGLCCNGVIFADVRLQPDDDVERLESLGLLMAGPRARRSSGPGKTPASKPSSVGRRPKFPQPCAAFDGCRCRIYADRPQHCRHFECSLLKKVKDGRIDAATGSRVVQAARQRADEVRRLLRELGETDEQVSLTVRFRRLRRRLESITNDGATGNLFGRLTLAVHDLNLQLSEAFYPGQ